MPRLSVVRALERDMRSYFTEHGYPEVIDFGRTALVKQLNQLPSPLRAGRIVIVPSDDTGKAGKLTHPRTTGQRPRMAYGHDHLVEIHCWGRALLNAAGAMVGRDDEGAHYDVAYDLYELAMCAVRASQVGRITFGDVRHEIEKEIRFGFVIVQQLILQGGLFEPDVAIVNPTTHALPDNALTFPAGDVPD